MSSLAKGFKILTLSCILIFSGSCENIYEEIGSNDTQEAILYQARMYLADGQWALAIAEFERLPATLLSTEEVAVEYASAFSGRCGLDFLTLANALQNIGTTRLLDLLMDTFPSSAVANFNDCKEAEDILKTVDDGAGVLATERGKYLMAFNSLAKIGVLLNYYADTDENLAVDAGWDPCDGNGATDLPAADVNEIGTGLTLFLANIDGLAGVSNVLADLETACAALGAANFCSIVDVAGFNATHRQGIRGVIRETSDGFGLGINGGDIAASVCEP